MAAGDMGPSDQAILDSLRRTQRLIQLAMGLALVGVLVVVAVVVLSRRDDGSSLVQATAIDDALSAAVTPVTTTPPTTTTTAVAGSAVAFTEPGDVLVSLSATLDALPPRPTTTVPTGWVEPEVEPESAWIDPGNGVALPDVLLRIRFCESTNNYQAANRYSTARGAYQFLIGSWEWYGHAERYGAAEAHLATAAQQDDAALRTFRRDGARPWAASRACWDDPGIDPRYLTAGPPPTTAPPTTTTTAPPSTTTTSTTSSSTSSTLETTTTSS